MGEGLEEVAELRVEREENRRDSLLGTTESSVDQQRRTTFCASKHVRSSYKPSHFDFDGQRVFGR